MMRRLLLYALCLVPLAAVSAPMKSSLLWDVSDVGLTRSGKEGLAVRIDFNVLNDDVAPKSSVVLRPYIVVGGTAKYLLKPLSFYRVDGRGNRVMSREGSPTASGNVDEVVRVSGLSKGRLGYRDVTGGYSSKDSVEVFVEITEYRAPDKETYVETRKVAGFQPRPCPEFYPVLFPVYVSEGKYPLEHALKVPLHVTFDPKKRSAFSIHYEDNEGDVFEFSERVKGILNSNHVKVSSVTLKAYSGVEGPAADNVKLAKQRFDSVFSYLKKQNVFGKQAVEATVVGEDWDSVYKWFEGTFWANEKDVRDILTDRSVSPDTKEAKLKEKGVFWANLQDFVFPELDRMDCEIRYSLLPFGSDDERWRYYNEDKAMLSEYDFSCLMNRFNLWSSSWYDVVFDFADVYPECPEAQLNSFAASLAMGRLNEAGKCLRFQSSDQNVLYYRAVWLMYMGDIDGSYELSRSLDRKNIRFENTVNQIDRIYDWCHSVEPWKKTVYPRFNLG